MQFRVSINNPAFKDILSMRTILSAKTLILDYPFGASERLLDTYLRSNFSIGLRDACLTILFNLKKSYNLDTEIVFTLLDDELDKMAQLITCGLENTPGSFILLEAIGGIYK